MVSAKTLYTPVDTDGRSLGLNTILAVGSNIARGLLTRWQFVHGLIYHMTNLVNICQRVEHC